MANNISTAFLSANLLIAGLILGSTPVHFSKNLNSYADSVKSGKFALLIGINKYAPPLGPLNGAVADVVAIKNFLTDRKFGFPDYEDHIKILKDEEATGRTILETLRSHSIKKARGYIKKRPMKRPFFYFSGCKVFNTWNTC